MKIVLKTLFKETLVLKGGYMHGPLYAPLILAIPLIIVFSLMVLPFYPVILIIGIIEMLKKKERPERWELLGYVLYGVIFLIWLKTLL